jgi:uncharacterized membrane protein required for colicin V production
MIHQINWVDIFVVIFLIRGTYIGSTKGLTAELFKSLGLILVLVISFSLHMPLAQFLSSHLFFSLKIAMPVAFSLLAIAVFFVYRIIIGVCLRLMNIEFAEGLDKFGGIILGFLRGTVLASFIIFSLNLFPSAYVTRSIDKNSLSGKYLAKLAPVIYHFVTRTAAKENQISPFKRRDSKNEVFPERRRVDI